MLDTPSQIDYTLIASVTIYDSVLNGENLRVIQDVPLYIASSSGFYYV